MTRKQSLLFLIIIIEGYIVLATELLAIRQLIPFVGSGTEVVSIIISAILLPLALGYHAGGRRANAELLRARVKGKTTLSIRKILLRNLITALIILTFGLSYVILELFFGILNGLGLHQRILQTAIYSLCFLVTPTFLLAQTVPLISNYFSQTRLSEITGKMLFFSTTGSFLGSIVSTIVLMALIGVHNTVIITLGLIAALIVLITPRRNMFDKLLAVVFIGLAWLFNGQGMIEPAHIVADTPYSTIFIEKIPTQNATVMHINRSISSKYAPNPENRFEYIRYIEENFINTMKGSEPRDILALGAGGFTMGWDDTKNYYTFVDIDPVLQKTAEAYFLPNKLPANKQVVATSARAFLRRTTQHYDLVVIDLYSNIMSIPMESVTREFLQDAKNLLKPDGILIANIISSPTYNDSFSVRYYHTFASVFPVFDRQVIGKFNPWQEKGPYTNTLYIYYAKPLMDDKVIYTDDKNTYSFDR